MRESEVVEHLIRVVKAHGGEVRKTSWVGRRFCPDLRVLHPKCCFWAELKSPTGRLSVGQVNEIEKLRSFGEKVLILRSIEDVNQGLLACGILHEV